MKNIDVLTIIIISIIILSSVHCYLEFNINTKIKGELETPEIPDKPDMLEVLLDEYGIYADAFHVVDGRVTRNQTLSTILSAYNISSYIIHQIANFSRELFDVRRIQPGDSYKIFLPHDSLNTPHYFIYEPNQVEYIKVRLYDTIQIERGNREVHQVLKEVSGSISSSLWNAMRENQTPGVLAIDLSEIYAWSIDFFGLRKGDSFTAYYYENYVDSNSVGIDRIKAAWFRHMGREFYAIPFEQDSVLSFFDQNGNSLRRAFLKAPLRYSRISSRFSHSRMHPILRVRRPHHGVDYAAPAGTPVYSIGDGRVIETSYSGGAGRMVRIRHNSVYTSAYLHLRNFEPGIKPDVWVQQGDVIGYVGSTGLSTGPHLDFRVWRNGHPVDPLTIESPPVEPVKEKNMEAFIQVRDFWMERLNNLSKQEVFASKNL